MSKRSEIDKARRKAKSLGLTKATRTLIVCMDRKTGKCCNSSSMRDAWTHLKRRAKDWKKSHGESVLRLKTACIGVCHAGPIIGVLPDGVWYGRCDEDVIDRIFDEHLGESRIVDDHVIASPE